MTSHHYLVHTVLLQNFFYFFCYVVAIINIHLNYTQQFLFILESVYYVAEYIACQKHFVLKPQR